MKHPIETGNYIIPTPEIIETAKKIQWWIQNKLAGGIIYGEPRVGKTKAIILIAQTLLKNECNIQSFYMSAVKEIKNSETAFYTHLLSALDNKHSHSGTKMVKRERIIKYLLHTVITNEQESVCLIIDEAQNLTDIHYDWLISIYNELDYEGVRLLTLLVGQHQLMTKRSMFKDIGASQIVGRFMIDMIEFKGCNSQSKLKEILKVYDEETEYPFESNISYTEHFFPNSFKNNNFRLHHFSKELFEAIKIIHKEHNLPSKITIPMALLTMIVSEYFLSTHEGERLLEEITTDDWLKIIYSTPYISFTVNAE
ncbi:ATP-binding protein [Globicatella sanguinis]